MLTKLKIFLLLLFLAASAHAQTAIPAVSASSCRPAFNVSMYPDSSGNVVNVLSSVQIGEKCSYATALPAGDYSASVLAATTNAAGASMHIEFPTGTNVSGPIPIAHQDGAVGTTPTHFNTGTGPNTFTLTANATVLLVVDGVGGATSGGAHVNIETLTFTLQAPPPPPINLLTPGATSLTFSAQQAGTVSDVIALNLANNTALPVTITLGNTQQMSGQGTGHDFGLFPTWLVFSPIQPGNSTHFLVYFFPGAGTSGVINGNILVQVNGGAAKGGQDLNIPITGTAH